MIPKRIDDRLLVIAAMQLETLVAMATEPAFQIGERAAIERKQDDLGIRIAIPVAFQMRPQFVEFRIHRLKVGRFRTGMGNDRELLQQRAQGLGLLCIVVGIAVGFVGRFIQIIGTDLSGPFAARRGHAARHLALRNREHKPFAHVASGAILAHPSRHFVIEPLLHGRHLHPDDAHAALDAILLYIALQRTGNNLREWVDAIELIGEFGTSAGRGQLCIGGRMALQVFDLPAVLQQRRASNGVKFLHELRARHPLTEHLVTQTHQRRVPLQQLGEGSLVRKAFRIQQIDQREQIAAAQLDRRGAQHEHAHAGRTQQFTQSVRPCFRIPEVVSLIHNRQVEQRLLDLCRIKKCCELRGRARC